MLRLMWGEMFGVVGSGLVEMLWAMRAIRGRIPGVLRGTLWLLKDEQKEILGALRMMQGGILRVMGDSVQVYWVGGH